MAIGNVDSILSKLRMMPDPQLQQFAAMHKNDPFLLPLAIQEDSARKQMRAAQQAQAMGGEPPKVVDQAVAAIGQMPQPQMPPQGPGGPMPQGGPMPPQGGPMPPQGAMPPQGRPPGPQGAGIAALQAPNMAKMADGGIAGYPDDEEVVMAEGGVARYNGATGSLTPTDTNLPFYSAQMRPQDDALTELHRQAYTFEAARVNAEQELATIESQLQKYGSRQRQADPEGFSRLVAARDEAKQRRDMAAKQYKQQSSLLVPQDEGERAYRNPRARTAEEAAIFNNLYATPPQGPMMPVPDVQMAGQPAVAAPPGAAPRPGPGANTRPGPGPGPGPGAATRPVAAAPAAAAPSPAMAMEKPTPEAAKLTAAQFLDTQGRERQLAEYQTAAEKSAAEDLARTRAALKRDDKAGAGLEALLKKEEAGVAKEMEQSKAFAIINAGLAMMAGGSPNALQNIAQGAMVGTRQYQEALKDFSKAAKERQKAFASIEEARRAEARDDAKAMLAAEQRYSDSIANARKFAVQGSMELGVKSAEMAGRAFDSAMTQYGADRRTQMELESREREGAAGRSTQLQIANISAGTKDSPLALYRALGDGDVKKGFEFAQEGKVGGSLIKAIVEGVLKNPLMMREYPPAVQQLVNQELTKLGVVSGVTSNPPANAQILK